MAINVSTNQLDFPKNNVSTKTLDITSSYFFAVNVDMKHNLPPCFSFFKPAMKFQLPYTLKITYNPQPDMCVPSEPLKICFSNKWTTLPEKPITVVVKLVDDLVPQKNTPKKTSSPEKSSPFSEQLECKICLQRYSEDDEDLIPRVLTGCGHTLCQKCVGKLMKKSNGFRFQCPFDRHSTASGAVQNLPKNRAVIDMLRELKETESTEISTIYEDPDVPCFENKNHEATCFCFTCKEDFCQTCFDSTHSSKIFSTHQSIPLSEKPCEIPKCPIHEKLEIRYFCTDDECTLSTREFCDECLLAEHKSHWYENIETRIKKNQEVLQDAVKNLKERETKMLQNKDAIIKCLGTFDEKEEGISQKRKTIEFHFDNMKREAAQKFDNWLAGRKKNLEFLKENMQDDVKVLTSTRREIEKTLLKKGSVLNVKELIEKSKYSVDSEIKAGTLPYNDYVVPNDMSQEPYPKNSSSE